MALPPISYSMRSKFKDCPRKLFFRYVAGIDIIAPDSPARAIGRAFHSALEGVRLGTDLDEAIKQAKEDLEHDLSLMEMADVDLMSHLIKLSAYVKGYMLRFNDDSQRWLTEHRVAVGNELGFIDGLRLGVDIDEPIMVEDKTCSVFAQYMDFYLPHSEQLLNYLRLLNKEGTYKVSQIFYRETKKTTSKKNKKEDWDDFAARMHELYIGSGDKYRQTIVTIPMTAIKQYDREVKVLDIEIINKLNNADRLNEWPRNSSSCHGKFGACDFLPACGGCDAMDELYMKRSEFKPLDGGKFAKKHKLKEM